MVAYLMASAVDSTYLYLLVPDVNPAVWQLLLISLSTVVYGVVTLCHNVLYREAI
jgi:hypothetical protein